jgi:uncharacterized protein YecT (DUF1311 family)
VKRLLLLVLILALSVSLLACTSISASSGDEPQQDSMEQTIDPYFGQYQMADKGFSSLVKDNAIDRDYKTEWDKFQKSQEFSTQGWVELEARYRELWDKELNNTYNKLMKELNEQEKKKLLEAQAGWVQFHTNESEFVETAWEELGLGSQGRIQLITAEKDRIRERTLQLMEYFNMLGGDIEFLYKGLNN